jgi:nucleoside-diphosphate-sugar epimerase
MGKKLVVGANGQIGSDLVNGLIAKYGKDVVVASDINESRLDVSIPFEKLDVLNKELLKEVILKHNIKEVYLLAAILSATGEKNPLFAWELNMNGLLNVLELGKDKIIDKIFWPSSIAVFGPSTPRENTPQITIMEPTTVYGISKLAGERWCEYYHNKYGVDIRSIRYPGLISHKTEPGGGTTDYAVDIFHKAVSDKKYTCYLESDTYLPMMYMDDAIRATISLMEADSSNLTVRSSYNISGISFSPEEISNSIKTIIPDFSIDYKVDFRQEIANSWPKSINDTVANKDWGWKNEFSLQEMTNVMLTNLQEKVSL